MRLRGGGITRSITVRRIASGVGVERTFKIHSPRIEKIEVIRHGKVRRAQLYFLRDRVGKAATLRERRTNGWPRPSPNPRPRQPAGSFNSEIFFFKKLSNVGRPRDDRHRPDPSPRAPPVERGTHPGRGRG